MTFMEGGGAGSAENMPNTSMDDTQQQYGAHDASLPEESDTREWVEGRSGRSHPGIALLLSTAPAVSILLHLGEVPPARLHTCPVWVYRVQSMILTIRLQCWQELRILRAQPASLMNAGGVGEAALSAQPKICIAAAHSADSRCAVICREGPAGKAALRSRTSVQDTEGGRHDLDVGVDGEAEGRHVSH